MVRPPPQPMSRIVSCGLIEMWWRPQSVTAEWLLFIRKSSRRPSHPEGLLDCVTGTSLGATPFPIRCAGSGWPGPRAQGHNPGVADVAVPAAGADARIVGRDAELACLGAFVN